MEPHFRSFSLRHVVVLSSGPVGECVRFVYKMHVHDTSSESQRRACPAAIFGRDNPLQMNWLVSLATVTKLKYRLQEPNASMSMNRGGTEADGTGT